MSLRFQQYRCYLWQMNTFSNVRSLQRSTSMQTYGLRGGYCFKCFPGGSVDKNLPALWETWVQSPCWEDSLEEGMETHSSILAWRIPMDRGAWWAMVHGVVKSRTWLSTDFVWLLQALYPPNTPTVHQSESSLNSILHGFLNVASLHRHSKLDSWSLVIDSASNPSPVSGT